MTLGEKFKKAILFISSICVRVIPLIMFIINKNKKDKLCWFLYGFALIGLIQTAPDCFALV